MSGLVAMSVIKICPVIPEIYDLKTDSQTDRQRDACTGGARKLTDSQTHIITYNHARTTSVLNASSVNALAAAEAHKCQSTFMQYTGC